MPLDKALASADTPAFLTGRPSSPPDVDRVQAGSHIGLVLVSRSDLRSDPDYGLRQKRRVVQTMSLTKCDDVKTLGRLTRLCDVSLTP